MLMKKAVEQGQIAVGKMIVENSDDTTIDQLILEHVSLSPSKKKLMFGKQVPRSELYLDIK